MKVPDFFYGDEYNEKIIENFKLFYFKHLMNIKKRKNLVFKLNEIIEKHNAINPIIDTTKLLEFQTGLFLEKKFSKSIKEIYDQKPKKQTEVSKFEPKTNNTLITTLEIINRVSTEFNKQKTDYWNKRLKFLKYLSECIDLYGLHKLLETRNGISEKRFNLAIKHNFKSEIATVDYQILLSFEKFNLNFSNNYRYENPIKINGKIIPFKNITQVKITTTNLKDDELILFAKSKNIKWTEDEKDIEKFFKKTKDETEEFQPIPNEINVNITHTKQLLEVYPNIHKLYCNALEKTKDEKFFRNSLDDFRLVLELLLKKILNNNKSLENQKNELGKFLKNKQTSVEIRNSFMAILDLFIKFQNENVKHNNNVKETDIKYIFNTTSTLIEYLI